MISGSSQKVSASIELDAAMRELIADIEQTNPDLRLQQSSGFQSAVFLRASSIGPANRRSSRKESHRRSV